MAIQGEERPKLIVERATSPDAAALEALLDAAAEWHQERGLRHWTPGTFTDEIADTIAHGTLHAGWLNGTLVGCFMLDEGSPRLVQWLTEHGREPRSGLIIGRLAVAREAVGQGLGAELLNEAHALADRQGVAFVWLDCPAENERLRRYYQEAGFSYLGDDHIPGPNGEAWVSSVFEFAIRNASGERGC
jgi:GNAT superfamily N-acetyltransferase